MDPFKTGIEFRGGMVDRTVEAYCPLCGRVLFEMHEDSIEDGMALAETHWRKFHVEAAYEQAA